ncbi:MAG: exodeoxyribonuclease VII large subunit [Candidatus Sungbacteria bacterium]|nr:exodeoxyribonuclease VII large subunit [Candidatus Sungbacteria bacterium]
MATGTEEKIFSVGQFLDLLNIGLRTSEAKIVGEVSSCDFRLNYLFFTLKDNDDGSAINCFMWQREYRMSGVVIGEGMEIIAHGFPEIYKPSGRLSFHADSIELIGEGALKKAYDELRQKLEREGMFAPERKRAIPEYPEEIGLITSKTGAVIHDFLNNIGKFGYQIKFIDSRVEGQLAVGELLAAVRSFRDKDIDVLVVIRGGGSLESLLAFNNEMLVREISRFPKPVICGIGHDKDVPLMALAADIAVSTPTAVTRVLNSSWEQALSRVRLAEREIFGAYHEALLRKRHTLEFALALPKYFSACLDAVNDTISGYQKTILAYDPERQLKLGYSIARVRGKIIRSARDVYPGDALDLTFADGMIETEVKKIRS